jgi:inositol polyphosphate 5-phosphatase INPP5B/F
MACTLSLPTPYVFDVYAYFSYLVLDFRSHDAWTVSSSPLDLRITHQPLHTRLSPSSAGFPGDEAANIRLVRDDWVRHSAWTACVNVSDQSKQILRYICLSNFVLTYSEGDLLKVFM